MTRLTKTRDYETALEVDDVMTAADTISARGRAKSVPPDTDPEGYRAAMGAAAYGADPECWSESELARPGRNPGRWAAVVPKRLVAPKPHKLTELEVSRAELLATQANAAADVETAMRDSNYAKVAEIRARASMIPEMVADIDMRILRLEGDWLEASYNLAYPHENELTKLIDLQEIALNAARREMNSLKWALAQFWGHRTMLDGRIRAKRAHLDAEQRGPQPPTLQEIIEASITKPTGGQGLESEPVTVRDPAAWG